MRLEEEIKQSKFPNPHEKAIVNILYTYNWLKDKNEIVMKPHKINEQHYNILRILRGKSPGTICPGEIKEVLINKRGDLTRLLDKLVSMDLVERDANPENRRMVLLKITSDGLRLLEDMEPEFKQIEEKNLTDEEALHLSNLLDKMRG